MTVTCTVGVPEAADMLGVSPDTLYTAFRTPGYLAAGPARLWPIRAGNRLLVGRKAITEFCAAIELAPSTPSLTLAEAG